MTYIDNSSVVVVGFLLVYLVFINYLFKRLHNNHFGLKALIIFIFATLVGQIAKVIPEYPRLAYNITTYAMITIDMGTIFLFLKEIKKTYKTSDILRLYLELTTMSLLVLVVSLFTKNTGYIRIHSSLTAFIAIIIVLFRLFKFKNVSYDISFILSYLGYGIFCMQIGLYELGIIPSSLYYYIFICVGFIFHIIGLTRRYQDES